jgi:hypothetical protein
MVKLIVILRIFLSNKTGDLDVQDNKAYFLELKYIYIKKEKKNDWK